MDLAQAVQHAESILDEEGAFSTVDYIDPIVEWNDEIKNSGGQHSPPSPAAQKAVECARKRRGDNPHNLYHERSLRPRPVHESPYDFVFKSDNFEMLRRLFNQLPPNDRSDFLSSLLARFPVARGRCPAELRFPCHQHQMCELPLVAEFTAAGRLSQVQADQRPRSS